MLRCVNAAGVRRRAANGFPVNDSVLLRSEEKLNEDHEYMVWPRPPKGKDGRHM
jgi:hypothetical protein